ncbi:TetR family transcriptional regulator [Aliidongia dinghuensis]|uniref:TetR family transcriptional regulator n=1 Tax=Aliidongia dinghuensis TaxID=1867774 RepID=A0A8J2YTV7_9PROT|nr:TetR/AcrR family transcriptional regulator [Aliidongia dinghuensis]GGF17313.1 TetR family transcriptional regulator [Aliidongia dinghuensis]
MAKDTYHHGNLRAALLNAALNALKDEPPAKLSLRQLAGCLGVSANAPYAHFASKDDLLDALRREGFVELKSEMADALAVAGSGRSVELAALGRAYLRFGREKPHLYALMFAEGPVPSEATASAATDSFALLRQTVEGLGTDPDLAHFAWALVHGLVTLDAAGQLEPLGAAPIEDLAPRLAQILIGTR